VWTGSIWLRIVTFPMLGASSGLLNVLELATVLIFSEDAEIMRVLLLYIFFFFILKYK
jgi:hypothetical protein